MPTAHRSRRLVLPCCGPSQASPRGRLRPPPRTRTASTPMPAASIAHDAAAPIHRSPSAAGKDHLPIQGSAARLRSARGPLVSRVRLPQASGAPPKHRQTPSDRSMWLAAAGVATWATRGRMWGGRREELVGCDRGGTVHRWGDCTPRAPRPRLMPSLCHTFLMAPCNRALTERRVGGQPDAARIFPVWMSQHAMHWNAGKRRLMPGTCPFWRSAEGC